MAKLKLKKLSPEDVSYLLSLGYRKEDMEPIDEAVSRSKYWVKKTGKLPSLIRADQAREILGDKVFLLGIARSAFHWNHLCDRKAEDGRVVSFDSSMLFK